MTIKIHITIDSAHKLNLPYESKCNNLHGHRWEIDIEISIDIAEGAVSPLTNGMIIDFTHIKEYFKKYDHQYLNDLFPEDFHTTAENLARFWTLGIDRICLEKMDFDHPRRIRVSVAETPNNIATYEI